MTREIDASVAAASQEEVVRPVVLARLDFAGGVVAANSGNINIDYAGDTYLGVGALGGISAVREASESQPYSINLSLTGIESSYISIALNEHYQGRDARIYVGLLDSDHQLIDNPVLIFRGRMDTMDITMGKTASIDLKVQSRMVDWDRPRVQRYNNEDQIARYPDDKGLEFVPQMVEKTIIWGRA